MSGPAPGQPLEIAYEIAWQGDTQQRPPGSWVTQSRRGIGYLRDSDKAIGDQVQYVIDFAGPALDALPARYRILETSADLRERQRTRVAERIPALAPRVEHLDAPPAEPWRGVLFANEVVDALPVRRFVARRDGDFNAMRGMVSERFYQTDCFRAKGSLLPLSHAWTGGVLLFACLAALEDPDSYAVPD